VIAFYLRASACVFLRRTADRARPADNSQETEAIAIDLVRHILFLHARRAPFHKKDMKEVIRDRHAPRSHAPLLKRAAEVR
jgi:hypothetical protein